MPLIVVGVDGSEQSRRALRWALPYASLLSATVQAVTVVDTRRMDRQERVATLAHAEGMLASMVRDVAAAYPGSPAVAYDVLEGDPVVALVGATQSAELIVLGSHRMTSLRNPALSTLSMACIRMGACPVLVIPISAPKPAQCRELVPT